MLKKFSKLFSVFSVSLCLVLNMTSSVFALNSVESSPEIVYSLSQDEIEENFRTQIERAKRAQPRMDEYVYEYYDMGTGTSEKSDYYVAGNQPISGVVFEGSIGSIYWADSSYVEETVSLSVGFSYGYGSVSIGITPGVRSPEKTSYGQEITRDQIGKHVLLKVAKDFEVRRYAVYRYNKYSPSSTKVFVRYEDYSSLNSLYLRIDTVK